MRTPAEIRSKLTTDECIRSGEYVDPYTHRRLVIPAGFRYYWKGQGAPARLKERIDAILTKNPKTKWIIASIN